MLDVSALFAVSTAVNGMLHEVETLSNRCFSVSVSSRNDIKRLYSCQALRNTQLHVNVKGMSTVEPFLTWCSALPSRFYSLSFAGEVDISDEYVTTLTQTQLPLQRLDLSGSCITEQGLKQLSLSFSSLTTLTLKGCKRIRDGALRHLARLPLHTLDLNNCTGLTDIGLQHLATSYSLHTLDLSQCWLNDEMLSHLMALPLQVLNISKCGMAVTDRGIGYISQINSLHTLLMRELWVSDDALLQLSCALSLSTLDLTSCRYISDLGLSHLRPLGARLKSLNLQGLTGVTNLGLNILAEFSGLTYLNIANCMVSEEGLEQLSPLEGLQELDITGCTVLQQRTNWVYAFGMPVLKQALPYLTIYH